MATHKNSRSRPVSAVSRLNGQRLVKIWHVADTKITSAKNQEVEFLAVKCKITPVLVKSAGACANFGIHLRRLPQQNERWYVGVFFPSFQFHVSVGASQKKPDFGTPKMKKKNRGRKQKLASVAFLAIPRATRMSYMASFWQTMLWSCPILAHFT
jgi:hypothetical protein